MDYHCPKCNTNLRFKLLPHMDVSKKRLFAGLPYENQKICPSCKCLLIDNSNSVDNNSSKYMFFALSVVLILRFAGLLNHLLYIFSFIVILGYYFFWSEVKLKDWPRYIEGSILPLSKEVIKKQEIASQLMILFLLLITMILAYWRWW